MCGMSGLFLLNRMHQKLGRDDNRREESGGGVEKAETCLFADVCKMAEIPRDDVVDLVKRGKGDVDGVGYVFAVKNAAVDIAFGEDRDFLGQLELFERFYQIEVTCAMRLMGAFELTLD